MSNSTHLAFWARSVALGDESSSTGGNKGGKEVDTTVLSCENLEFTLDSVPRGDCWYLRDLPGADLGCNTHAGSAIVEQCEAHHHKESVCTCRKLGCNTSYCSQSRKVMLSIERPAYSTSAVQLLQL